MFRVILLFVGLSLSRADDACCKCIKGSDMGADLYQFSSIPTDLGKGVDACSRCCGNLPGFHDGETVEDGICKVHRSVVQSLSCAAEELQVEAATKAAAEADTAAPGGKCCECEKGSDMGSDLLQFSSVPSRLGQGADVCAKCCVSLPEYRGGQSVTGSVCDAHRSIVRVLGSCTAAGVATLVATENTTKEAIRIVAQPRPEMF